MPLVDEFARAQAMPAAEPSTSELMIAARRDVGGVAHAGRRRRVASDASQAPARTAGRSDGRGLDGLEGRVKTRLATRLHVVLYVAGAIALVEFAVLLPSLIAAGASFLI